jgi:hypothetical protein
MHGTCGLSPIWTSLKWGARDYPEIINAITPDQVSVEEIKAARAESAMAGVFAAAT